MLVASVICALVVGGIIMFVGLVWAVGRILDVGDETTPSRRVGS